MSFNVMASGIAGSGDPVKDYVVYLKSMCLAAINDESSSDEDDVFGRDTDAEPEKADQ